MNYNFTKKKSMAYADLCRYLTNEGFLCGRNRNGFVAVDKHGVVFECSPWRTYGSVRHKTSPVEMVKRVGCVGIPIASWLTTTMDSLRKWSVDPLAVVESEYPKRRKAAIK